MIWAHRKYRWPDTQHHSDMKTLDDHISTMLTKRTNTSSKTDKQEEQLTDISSKLSHYEDRLDTLIIKEK